MMSWMSKGTTPETVWFSDPAVVAGWSGHATDGFELSPTKKVWPNLREQSYQIRALGGATGSFSIQTNTGIGRPSRSIVAR